MVLSTNTYTCQCCHATKLWRVARWAMYQLLVVVPTALCCCTLGYGIAAAFDLPIPVAVIVAVFAGVAGGVTYLRQLGDTTVTLCDANVVPGQFPDQKSNNQ